MGLENYYYKISVCLPATWKENLFTYTSTVQLETGVVVLVPFGKEYKLGFVSEKDNDPTVKNIKPIEKVFDYRLGNETLKLVSWMNENYPNMPGVHTQHVLPSGLKTWKHPANSKVDPKNKNSSLVAPNLTQLQIKTIQTINSNQQPQMLHGITGSGKTRVYLELILNTLQSGKNVLVLYPEISLTTHMEHSLKPYLPSDSLHIYHSKSTPAQRKNTWLAAINKDKSQVFIGPRSALFLPLDNLGLIIVDEAHDSSYKQDSGSRYNGLLVAASLARISGAKLLFGSATPPVHETKLLSVRENAVVCMHELAMSENVSKRNFSIVDMTKKENISSLSYLLSKKLIESLQSSLRNNKQSILFLNRRGTARSVVCESCGWHAACTQCDSSLTYHHDSHTLKCHICGLNHRSVNICPDCSSEISLQTPGTKALIEDLQKKFPEARIKRFDSDNKKADSLAENYEQLRQGEVDIVVGTQLLTKGLDLPNLETIGIIQADSSLFLPDYSSTERTFQLLTQVSGRVGRGHSDGEVVIQTYNPSSALFKLVINQDWHTFYDSELASRNSLHFPPYNFLAKLWVLKNNSRSAQKSITEVKNSIHNPQVKILGPAPSFYEKNSGKYSWQILLQSKNRKTLLQEIRKLPKDVYYDLDPVSLL